MPEIPRREDLDPHWQSVLDDLESRLAYESRRRLSLLRRSRRHRRERDQEQARNNVLRAEIANLKATLTAEPEGN